MSSENRSRSAERRKKEREKRAAAQQAKSKTPSQAAVEVDPSDTGIGGQNPLQESPAEGGLGYKEDVAATLDDEMKGNLEHPLENLLDDWPRF